MQRLATLLLFVLIAACQPAYIHGRPNLNSPYFQVPTDSKLVLKQEVTVDAGQKSAYFQRGKLVKWFNVQKFEAYCALALDRKADAEQTVKPGEFDVYRVHNESLFTLAKKRNAPTDDFRVQTVGMRDNSQDSYQVMAVLMELRSTTQSNVKRLTCASWVIPQGMQSVTVNGIRASLGDYATLNLPPMAQKP